MLLLLTPVNYLNENVMTHNFQTAHMLVTHIHSAGFHTGETHQSLVIAYRSTVSYASPDQSQAHVTITYMAYMGTPHRYHAYFVHRYGEF